MLLYYITDRKSLAGTDAQQRRLLLTKIGGAAQAGVDYIQLREKDLAASELEQLARDAVQTVHEHSETAKLLVNGRADVAIASGADGVHLPAGAIDASEVRELWRRVCDCAPVIAVSVHTSAEVTAAATQEADFAVLAPIFEKPHTDLEGIGLDALRAACSKPSRPESQRRLPVLALGGVTLANAAACLASGAAGVAGIRLFQKGDIAETVRRLREFSDFEVSC